MTPARTAPAPPARHWTGSHGSGSHGPGAHRAGSGGSADPAAGTDSFRLSHGFRMKVISGLLAAMFLAALDITVVETAIRTIADDFDSLDRIVWVSTAYLITGTVTTPLYGRLSDLYGRRPLYLTAIVIFLVGSVLAGLARSMPELTVGRAVQGLGAGGMFSLTLSIVGDLVPARERARYQGYFIAVFGTSAVAGPVVGGLFAGQSTLLGVTGWRWVFLANLPIGLFALVVALFTVRIPQVLVKQRVDYLGALGLAATLVPALIYAEFGREWGWLSGRSQLMIAASGLGLVFFVLVERRMGDDAILPARLFRNTTMPVVAAMNFVVGAGMFGGLAALPLYLQIVRGRTPVGAGLLLLPMSAGIALGAMLSGQLISRTGRYRHSPIVGTALLVAGMISLSQVSLTMSMVSVGWREMLFGLGLGLTMQPLLVAAQNVAPPGDLGSATAAVTLFRQIGGTAGTSVCLSLLFDVADDRIQSSLDRAVGDQAFARTLVDLVQVNTPQHQQLLGALVEQMADGRSSVVERVTQNSSVIDLLSPVLAEPILVGFTQAIAVVFAVSACVLVLSQLLVVALPDRRLLRTAEPEPVTVEVVRTERLGAEPEPEPELEPAAAGRRSGGPLVLSRGHAPELAPASRAALPARHVSPGSRRVRAVRLPSAGGRAVMDYAGDRVGAALRGALLPRPGRGPRPRRLEPAAGPEQRPG